MVIAIIDSLRQAEVCAGVVRKALPHAVCLITATVRDLWHSDTPVPPLSGVLVHGLPEDFGPEEREALNGMARRLPFASTDSGDEILASWAARCRTFSPQFPRQPDRLRWSCALVVQRPGGRAPRMCSTGNVSLGGLYVADPRSKPSVGDSLCLRFPSLGPRAAASAVVRWVQPRPAPTCASGYGCEFAQADRWVPGILVNAARQTLAAEPTLP